MGGMGMERGLGGIFYPPVRTPRPRGWIKKFLNVNNISFKKKVGKARGEGG